MAFQYNAFGQKVSSDPTAAHARLVVLFEKHDCSPAFVAAEFGVNRVTLYRWVAKLVALGYPDPGDGIRRMRGGDLKARAVPKGRRRSKKKTAAVR